MAANVSRRSLKRKLFPVALYCPSFSSVARIEKKKAVSPSSPPQRVFRTVRIPNCMPHAPMVNVTVTNDGLQAMEWVRKHLKEGKGNRAVGFDVEWRPSFKAKEYNKVALVQLATDTEVLLLQLSHSCDPIASHEALRPVLSSKDIIKVGVGVALDLKRLSADYNFDTFDGYCDVGAVARRVMGTGGLGGNTLGLASAYAQCFGVEVPKVRAVQMSNWEAVKLSQAQIQYAAWDALMGLQVYGHQRAVENAFGEGSYAKQVKHCLSLLSSRPPTRSDYKSILRICSEVLYTSLISDDTTPSSLFIILF